MTIHILSLTLLFSCLLVAGLVALLPLFHWRFSKLMRSSLFVKTFMWVPIYIGFVGALYLGFWYRLVLILAINYSAYLELKRQLVTHSGQKTLLQSYYFGFAFASLQLVAIGLFFNNQQVVNLLVTVCMASALSDVVAFFFGNYLGKHHLPKALNERKSWEGVLGQFVGALIGVILLQIAGIPSIFWLWLPIGLGTAAGDLANSYVKRRIEIKDWGSSIPGHGGYLDRFPSLFGGLTLASFSLMIWTTFR